MPQPRRLGSIPNSQLFRFRAEKTRTLAQTFKQQQTRAMLLRVADDYDRMADRALASEESVALLENDFQKAKR